MAVIDYQRGRIPSNRSEHNVPATVSFVLGLFLVCMALMYMVFGTRPAWDICRRAGVLWLPVAAVCLLSAVHALLSLRWCFREPRWHAYAGLGLLGLFVVLCLVTRM